MKSSVFLISTLLAVSMHYRYVNADKEKMMEAMEKCKQKEGADDATIDALKQKKLPERLEGKCVIACMLEEHGMMKDGALNKEGALSAVEKFLAANPEKIEKAKHIIETCAKEVGEEPGDRCEVALKIAECKKKHSDGDEFN